MRIACQFFCSFLSSGLFFVCVDASWLEAKVSPLIFLKMLTQSHHIPGINTTWLWYVLALMYCCISFFNILFRIFASTFMNEIDLQFSFCDNVYVRIWCLDYAGLIKWVGTSSHFSFCLQEFLWVGVILFLKRLLKSSGPGVFIVGKLLIVDFISLVDSRLFIFSVVFLCQF